MVIAHDERSDEIGKPKRLGTRPADKTLFVGRVERMRAPRDGRVDITIAHATIGVTEEELGRLRRGLGSRALSTAIRAVESISSSGSAPTKLRTIREESLAAG